MSKIFLAGDTHGSIAHVHYLLRTALDKGCRFVVVLGDFGAWEHMKSGIEFFDAVDKAAGNLGSKVFFIRGNHDKSSLVEELYGEEKDNRGFLEVRYNLSYIPDGTVWTWGRKTFMALGGAYSVDKDARLDEERRLANREGMPDPSMMRGTYWFEEEEMSDADLERYLAAAPDDGVDFLLTHDKPRASNPDWNRKDIPECWPNQDRIQEAVRQLKPSYLFHGHLHYRYNDQILCGDDRYTRVIGLDCDTENSGSGVSRTSWVVLDTDEPHMILV